MLNFLLSLTLAYLFTTLWETLLHWKILHASRKTRHHWRKHPWITRKLKKAYFSHNRIHHRYTYNPDYYRQFPNQQAKQHLDAKLKHPIGTSIRRNCYGLTISTPAEIATFTLPPMLAILLTFPWFAPQHIPLGLLIATLPMWLSKYIHPLIHHPKDHPILQTTRFNRWISQTAYFRYIQHCHHLHHKHGLCNFNLLPGGDILLGVYKKGNYS